MPGLDGGLAIVSSISQAANHISDLAPLRGLTQLTELWLHGNQFQSVDVLTNLSELRTIELSGNQITHRGVLIALTKLDSLYLTGNPIEPGPELEALFRTHVAPRWDSEAGFIASLTWVLKGNGIRVESSEEGIHWNVGMDLRNETCRVDYKDPESVARPKRFYRF